MNKRLEFININIEEEKIYHRDLFAYIIALLAGLFISAIGGVIILSNIIFFLLIFILLPLYVHSFYKLRKLFRIKRRIIRYGDSYKGIKKSNILYRFWKYIEKQIKKLTDKKVKVIKEEDKEGKEESREDLLSFEIKLLFIAILIPVFFEYFPILIEKMIPYAYPFKLQLPQIISYVIGVSWIALLLYGMFELSNDNINSPLFKKLFRFMTELIIYTLGFMLLAYAYGILTINLLPLFIEKSPNLVAAVTFIMFYALLGLYWYIMWRRRK